MVPNSPISCLYPLTFLNVALSGLGDANDPPAPLLLEGKVAECGRSGCGFCRLSFLDPPLENRDGIMLFDRCKFVA